MLSTYFWKTAACITVVALCACSSKREFAFLAQNRSNAQLFTQDAPHMKTEEPKGGFVPWSDTLSGSGSGPQNRIIMNAVVEDGEYVSVDTLRRVCVTASYRHIPERGGVLDIPFAIVVPPSLLNDKWQLRLNPKLFWGADSLSLDGILITGEEYKNQKIRGLEKYKKFVESIVTNPDDYLEAFGYLRLIEKFCSRNVEKGLYGANRKEAEEYYINRYLLNSNNKKIRELGQRYREWCAFFQTSGDMRLDTIITDCSGSLVYKYLQRVGYKKTMDRLKVAFSGELCSVSHNLYTLPPSDTITYNITSLAQFTSSEPVYIDKVVQRRVNLESSAFLNFELGKWDVIDTLSNNSGEIAKIRNMFERIAEEDEFEVDSIIITANCSPEGAYKANSILAKKRSESVRDYFGAGILKGIKLINRYESEDWKTLQKAYLQDPQIKDKAFFTECYKIEDLDAREKAFSTSPDYKYVRDSIYPLLRRIDIFFALHRKGMVKDTIHTQEPDLNYMKASEALFERDYSTAAELLKNYRCANNAIALMGLERNEEALSILNSTPDSAIVNYLRAIIYARMGNDGKALQNLDSAVREDDSLAFRIKFDPEVNSLALRHSRDYINKIY